MVEPPTFGRVYVGETTVDVGSTPTPVTRPQTVGGRQKAKRYYSNCEQTKRVGDVRSASTHTHGSVAQLVESLAMRPEDAGSSPDIPSSVFW